MMFPNAGKDLHQKVALKIAESRTSLDDLDLF